MDMTPVNVAAWLSNAVDPDHPDAEILRAYDRWRDLKRFAYTDDPDGTRWTGEQEALHYDELDKAEAIILNGTALTPVGVAVRLALALPLMDQSGWVDRGLADHGIIALYHARERLENGTDRETITAAFELLQIEWRTALAAFEKAEADLDAVLDLKSKIDTEHFQRLAKTTDPDGFRAVVATAGAFRKILEAVDALERRFSGNAAINRLMATLAPDFPAYQRKAQIAIEQGYTSEAAPWLLRDINFLMGQITEDEPQTEEQAA